MYLNTDGVSSLRARSGGAHVVHRAIGTCTVYDRSRDGMMGAKHDVSRAGYSISYCTQARRHISIVTPPHTHRSMHGPTVASTTLHTCDRHHRTVCNTHYAKTTPFTHQNSTTQVYDREVYTQCGHVTLKHQKCLGDVPEFGQLLVTYI